jgi:hypothetical protein
MNSANIRPVMQSSPQNAKGGLQAGSPEIAKVTLEWSSGAMKGLPVHMDRHHAISCVQMAASLFCNSSSVSPLVSG